MALEPFDFSCVVVLPDGTRADVQQTDVQRSATQDRIYYLAVRQDDAEAPFMGALHVSRASFATLDERGGNTRAEKSRLVAGALQAWVGAHGLAPDFSLALRVEILADRVRLLVEPR